MAKRRKRKNRAPSLTRTSLVRSSTYGDYYRAPRGTYKKARVNAAFAAEHKTIQSANRPAKILKDALDPYRADFGDGALWATLVSICRAQIKKHGDFDFARLEPFELHSRYPLDGILNFTTHVEREPASGRGRKPRALGVTLSVHKPPSFPKRDQADGYTLRAIVVFPNMKREVATTADEQSAIMPLNDEPTSVHFSIPVPRGATHYVLCVRVDGYERQEPCPSRLATGMRVVAAGGMG